MTTCITVRAGGESRSVSAYFLAALSPELSSITSEDLEQFNRLAESDQWLLELDHRELDNPEWVDLGPFIPEVMSLLIFPEWE